jgi:hypothetical protein
MSLDVSALLAEAKALGMYEEAKPRKRAITIRRYNVTVDGKIVAQFCTINDVRTLRQHYREQGKSIVIDEVYTLDGNYKDISNLPPADLPKVGKYSVAEIKGIQNFATPTITEQKEKSKRRNKRNQQKVVCTTRVIENPWRNPNSSLHKEYMKGVIRDGFIVTHKESGQILFWGQRKEVIDYLKDYSGDISQIKCLSFTKQAQKKYGLM